MAEAPVKQASPVQKPAAANKNPLENFKQLDTVLTILGGILIFIGSFLAWATINVFFVNLSVSGIDGDGVITVIAGGLLLLLAVLAKTVLKAKEQLIRKIDYIYLILALVALGVAVYDASQLFSVDDFGMIKVGVGLYLVIAGAVLACIARVKNIFNLKKQFGFIALGLTVAVIVGLAIAGAVNKDDFNGGDSLGSDYETADTSTSSDWLSGWQSNSGTSQTSLDITVLSKTARMTDLDSDYGYIQGELKNNNSEDAYITGLTASLYLNGTLVTTEDSYDYPTMLKAGETGAYKVYISDLPNYDEIRVTVDAKNTSWQTCEYFDVVSQTPRSSSSDWGYSSFYVAGEVENNTGNNYTYADVYVWLTDANNEVLDLESTYIDEINSGETRPYEASFDFDSSPDYEYINVLAIGCK